MVSMGEGQLVVITLEDDEYGLPIKHVREIMRIQEVTPIPDAPDYIQGLINLRGQAIPLINMHVRFGYSNSKNGNNSIYAIIADFRGILVALSVDQVREVSTFEDIAPPPPLIKVPFISGIINASNRIIMKLDLEKMLRDSGLDEVSLQQEVV